MIAIGRPIESGEPLHPADIQETNSSAGLRQRITIVASVVLCMNLGAWTWALLAFHDQPVLLGVALVIYGLGLRHAVDADHIAAIDNVTRKLMQDNQQPVAVGFFFAIGHASVVVVATAAIATIASALSGLEDARAVGSIVSACVSATFLLAVGLMNLSIFCSICQTYRRLRTKGEYVAEDLDATLGSAGFLSRLLRPLFRMVTRSWHMLPVGALFGLGFETATEVAVFGIAAAQASKDVPLLSILVFPALFTAAMALVDTTDGLLMLGAYRWATLKPMRKICYSMTITLTSAVVALLIGAIGVVDLVGESLGLKGGLWDTALGLKNHMDVLGLAVIALLLTAWLVSLAVYKRMRLDDVQPQVSQ